MAIPSKAILVEETAEPVSTDLAVKDEEVAQLAYSCWEVWGCPDGSEEENWGWAEEEWERRRVGPA